MLLYAVVLSVHACRDFLESPCLPLHGFSGEVGCTSPGTVGENILDEEDYLCEGFSCTV